jgi:lipid-A-disaccharide synthase
MRVFLSTADASGDLHGAGLLRAMRSRLDASGRKLDAYGLGGQELLGAGLQSVVPQSSLAVAGLVEVLASARRIVGAYRKLRTELVNRRPDVAVLVDSPDLNLPLAAVAKRARIPVVYYVAPQVWAWRGGRVRKLRRRVRHVGVIFPFEQALLSEAGVPATFVGHPLVDHIEARRPTIDRVALQRELGLDPERPILGLLPGSRYNEVARNLPLMLEVAKLLMASNPAIQVELIVASNVADVVAQTKIPKGISVVTGRPVEAMSVATLLLAAPGTATVEAGLLGVPMIVCHRVNPLSFEIARRVTRVPSSCMINLIAESGIVPEYIQGSARPAALAGRIAKLLADHTLRDELASHVRRSAARLGGPGAASRMAELVLEVAAKS